MKRKVFHPQGDMKQLTAHIGQVVSEGNVLQPGVSARSQLHSEAPRRMGATGETVAKRARVEPGFTGLGPEAKMLNDTFNFEPMSGTLEKPRTLSRSYFHDAEDSQYEEMADPQVCVFYNAQPVFNSAEFTSGFCLGNGQWVFLNIARRRGNKRRMSSAQQCHDVQLCNVSMINLAQMGAGSRMDPIVPQGPHAFEANDKPLIGTWVNCGTIVARDSVYTRSRTRNLPVVSCATEGVVNNDVVNYWAACYPPATVGGYGYWLHTRRPRDREKLKEYCDILLRLKHIDHDPKVTSSSEEEFVQLLKRKNEIDNTLTKPEDYMWVIEPDTSVSKAHPPQFMYTGCNWEAQGMVLPAVQFKDGISGMGAPSAYLDVVTSVIYPRAENLQELQKAIQRIPRCTVHLLGVA